jgi:RNA polymerase-binding transcription factor DksA
MSTMSPHDVKGLAEEHFERWRHLHDERRFRVEQLAGLDSQLPSSDRHSTVNKSLRMAAVTALREIDAALARMGDGRYGLCVACSQPLPDARLDVLPMSPLCMSCHYNEQNCRLAEERT